jgi:hypothetical protein
MKTIKRLIPILLTLFHPFWGSTQSNQNALLDSLENHQGITNAKVLYPFFNKLNARGEKAVRIVHWGDSHIQMGFLSEAFKTGMDSLYGINGFGAAFPYKSAKYNPYHSFTRVIDGIWKGGNMMEDSLSQSTGFMGFWSKTNDTSACIQFGISKSVLFQENNTHVKIFYQADKNAKIAFRGANLKLDSTLYFQPIFQEIDAKTMPENTWSVTNLIFDHGIDLIEVKINNNLHNVGINLHGAVFERSWNKGVTYNNCGVGGAQFKHLSQNSKVPIEQASVLGSDLIIISFGSNESYNTQFDNDTYIKSVTGLVTEIRNKMPDVSILFTGPPDTRSKNRYPRNVHSICTILGELSMKNGFAYWDLRKEMGGEGSIMKWLSKGLASSDKLHFTRNGYTIQGKWLVNAIYHEHEKYNKSIKHEE